MNKYNARSILNIFFLITIALSSGCGQSTLTDSPTLTPAPPQTLTTTITSSPTNIPRLNGYLVYSDIENIFLFNFQDETVKPLYRVGEGYTFSEPFVDSNTIYFLSRFRTDNTKGDVYQLFKMNFDGNEIEQLTFDANSPFDKFLLSGSSNGNKLAYIQKGNPYSVVIFDKDTKAVDVITDKDGHNYYLPSWSPDGKKVIFFKQGLEEQTANYVLNFGSLMHYSVDTGEIKELLSGEIIPIIKPSWSPDGKKIVISRFNGTNTWGVDVWILNIENDSTQKIVQGKDPFGAAQFDFFKWAPNKQLILYQANQLYIFDLNKSKTISVSYLDFGLGADGGLWSPDGRYIAYIIGPNQNPADTNSKRLTLLNIQDTETGQLFQFKIPWGEYMRMASWIYP